MTRQLPGFYAEPQGFADPDPEKGRDPGMKPTRAEALQAAITRTRSTAAVAGCTQILTRIPFDRPIYISAVTPCRRAIILELDAAVPPCPCAVCARRSTELFRDAP